MGKIRPNSGLVSTEQIAKIVANQKLKIFVKGGEFYSDKINQVLAELGPQLHTLYLIHAEEVDQAAVRSVARSCPNLATLGLYLCDFVDTSSSTAETAADPEQEFYHRRWGNELSSECTVCSTNLKTNKEIEQKFGFTEK